MTDNGKQLLKRNKVTQKIKVITQDEYKYYIMNRRTEKWESSVDSVPVVKEGAGSESGNESGSESGSEPGSESGSESGSVWE